MSLFRVINFSFFLFCIVYFNEIVSYFFGELNKIVRRVWFAREM